MKPSQVYTYRFNYSQSYRSPSLKELYYDFENHGGGFPIYGNKDLIPSISNYYSLSLELREYINNSIEFYYNDVSNMIANKYVTEDNQIVYKYHNYKDVNLFGLNISSLIKPTEKISFQSVYSYTGAISEFKDVLDGISSHSINSRLKYSIYNNIDVILSSKFNSSKTVDTSLEDLNNIRSELVLPAYSIIDITIVKTFKPGNYLKIGVKNIFDNKNYQPFNNWSSGSRLEGK